MNLNYADEIWEYSNQRYVEEDEGEEDEIKEYMKSKKRGLNYKLRKQYSLLFLFKKVNYYK